MEGLVCAVFGCVRWGLRRVTAYEIMHYSTTFLLAALTPRTRPACRNHGGGGDEVGIRCSQLALRPAAALRQRYWRPYVSPARLIRRETGIVESHVHSHKRSSLACIATAAVNPASP